MSCRMPWMDGVDLEPGDLIEIFRPGYQHWAVYVGELYVIHLAPPSEVAGAGTASSMSVLTNKAVVKKELLSAVVGADKYQVSNKHDGEYEVQPQNQIVALAEKAVGQAVDYNIASKNCEHFANSLRYNVARSDQLLCQNPGLLDCLPAQGTGSAVVHGDMDHKKKSISKYIRSKLSSLVDLEPGDLIEIFRLAYQHWVIYVGNGYVIHLAPPSELAGAGYASLMSTLSNKALVKKERLVEVVGSDHYRVNNKYDAKHSPLPVNKIIQLAEEKVGQELEYKLTSENCEHFVTELRYGVARSNQVRDFFVGATIVGLAGLFLGVGTAMVKKKQQQQQNQ